MKLAKPVMFILGGLRARMVVMRNQGYCWGHVVMEGEVPVMFDIHTSKHDFSEDSDDYAALQFILLARGQKVCEAEPA